MRPTTIRSSREIDRVFREGARSSSRILVVLALPTPNERGPLGRVAFVAGTKLGGAVVRNRTKRRLREAATLGRSPVGGLGRRPGRSSPHALGGAGHAGPGSRRSSPLPRHRAMSAGAVLTSIPRRVVMGCIRFYQRFISPITPPSCRFYPTCSSYALTSVERFGVLRGGWMGICRIARCHPFSPGGYDPVPETLDRHQHDHAPRSEEERPS